MLIPDGGWGTPTALRPDWGGLEAKKTNEERAASNAKLPPSQWKPPTNLPPPPVARQGTGVPEPKPINSVRDWLHRNDPEYQKPPVLEPGAREAPPQMSEGVQALLNSQNWQLPTEANQNKQPDMAELAFEKNGTKQLLQHDYEVTSEEWDRIKNTYSTPGAMTAGFVPTADMTTLGKNMPLMKLGEQESAALTWEQYDALSKEQRAAVDFNTLLIEARESDLGKSHYMPADKQAEYDSRVEKIFGKAGGSSKVAPSTVDLLSKLDLNLVGQDLDEFLSLERAIDVDELSNFKFSDKDIKTLDQEINGKTPAYKDVRSVENMGAIDTAAIQQAQQVIKTAMTNPEALTYDFNTLMFGPSAEQQLAGQPPMGFGTEEQWTNPDLAYKSGYFQSALGMLGTADLSTTPLAGVADPMAWLMEDMKGMAAYDANTPAEFMNYLANQVDLLGNYGSKEQATQAAMIAKRAGLGL